MKNRVWERGVARYAIMMMWLGIFQWGMANPIMVREWTYHRPLVAGGALFIEMALGWYVLEGAWWNNVGRVVLANLLSAVPGLIWMYVTQPSWLGPERWWWWAVAFVISVLVEWPLYRRLKWSLLLNAVSYAYIWTMEDLETLWRLFSDWAVRH